MPTVTFHRLGSRIRVQPWAPGGPALGELTKIGRLYLHVRRDDGRILVLRANEIIGEPRFRKDSG
jgi:hypothetical protein